MIATVVPAATIADEIVTDGIDRDREATIDGAEAARILAAETDATVVIPALDPVPKSPTASHLRNPNERKLRNPKHSRSNRSQPKRKRRVYRRRRC